MIGSGSRSPISLSASNRDPERSRGYNNAAPDRSTQQSRTTYCKSLKIRPHDKLQRAARKAAEDSAWLAEYRRHRPMIERTIAWLGPQWLSQC